ncbi:MAG TPA: hypothetical protein VM032_16170 [Vicinamibacterales bacterium]|nr:hypothetical protein [Vicinamibacterales bacterium]
MRRLLGLGLLLSAGAVTACTGLDRASTNVLSPTSTTTTAAATPTPAPAPTTPAAPSMLGTWSSNPLSGISASSCTGFSWQVTSQTATSLAGTFAATCANGMSATGSASGLLNGSDVPYTVSGTATVPGLPSCPFSIAGTAHIVDSNTLRIPYAGSTCLGPVSGEETLRRPTQPSPTPAPEPAPTPHPEPAPAPTPAESPFHVGPGPLSMTRAEQVINATADEFPGLRTARPSEAEAGAAATELLRRMIWHLRRAGFDAGRQKNPSGAISGDKLTVFADGAWHAVDVFYDYGTAGVPVKVIFWEVFPANPLPDEGIAD